MGVVIRDYPYSDLLGSTVVISDDSVRTTHKKKMKVVEIISLFPFTELTEVRFVRDIRIKDRPGFTAVGLYSYNDDIMFIDYDEVLWYRTLAHEMGHAVWDVMSKDMQLEWILLYFDILDKAEMEHPGGDEYSDIPWEKQRNFPTQYSMHSLDEYFAEVFMLYCINRDKLMEKFSDEAFLLDKHLKTLRE